MIRALVTYALRHRIIALALLAAFTAAGIGAFRRLSVEAYPDVTNVQTQIITLFPGHAAEEVERLITIPVENQMNGIPKRASMRSPVPWRRSVVFCLPFSRGEPNESEYSTTVADAVSHLRNIDPAYGSWRARRP